MTRILIVEDDTSLARALATAFSQLRPDLTIWTSSNGLEAKRLLGERRVDAVLTDVQMPEMDGFELLAWLLNHHPDVPVFTMSGHDTDDSLARLNTLGAIESFTKPLDAKETLVRLTEALSQSVRGHVTNVSLPSFLQLLEMERKTCDLQVAYEDRSGVLSVRKGALVDARTDDLRGKDAAIAIIAWQSPAISILRPSDGVEHTIQASLGFIVMEAMRVQDEAAYRVTQAANGTNGAASAWPATGSVWPAAGSVWPAAGSAWPSTRRSWRPPALPSEASGPEAHQLESRHRAEERLPSGAQAIAIIETATGQILSSASASGCPLEVLAGMAAQVLRQQTTTLRLCCDSEGVEELVLSTSAHCDLIRPLGGGLFALLVFAPEATNLVMARLELQHFIASYG